MKLGTDWKTITPITGIAVLLAIGIAGQMNSEGAGSLTPPSGEPTPTMPTLAEIDAKLDPLESSGKNFALRNTTTVQVWNSATSVWTPANTVTGLVNLIESDGNFGALGSSGGAAWSRSTSSWKTVTNIANASSMSESDGNFCIIGSSRATAWSEITSNWATATVSAPIRIEKSNGNFLVIGASQAAAWNQQTGNWTIQALSPSFIGTASAGN